MLKVAKVAAGLLLLATPAAPLLAQEEIEVAASAAFQHGQTGISLPPSLLSTNRDRVIAFAPNGFDLGATYNTRRRDTLISIYVYRAPLTDVSVNFDTVMRGIISREGFSPAEGASLMASGFRPPSHANADSLMVAFPVRSGGEFDSGGVALIPHDDWLVKVRVSADRSPAELAEFIGQIVADLNLPAPSRPAPLAASVAPCTTGLRSAEAQRLDASFEDVLPYALALEGMGREIEQAVADGAPVRREWCLDQGSGPRGVYRRVGTDDTYIIMLSDSGRLLQVGDAGEPWMGLSPENGGSYPVILSDAVGSTLYALFDQLPAPNRVEALLEGARSLIRSDRAGEVTVMVEASAD